MDASIPGRRHALACSCSAPRRPPCESFERLPGFGEPEVAGRNPQRRPTAVRDGRSRPLLLGAPDYEVAAGADPMTPVVRLLRIALELLRFELGSVMGRLMPSRSRLQSPQRFCFALARLGTTFIKFGQALSLRRDILPDDYIAALQSLQDHIAPFPARDAIGEIERGLGRPVKELFAHLDRKPLAAASVAQVHTARLHDGSEVIVKVRRAGIKRRIDRDMPALMMLTRIAMTLMRD